MSEGDMMPTLVRRVQVTDPDTGRTVVFHPGTVVPDRIAELIDDPRVWAEPEAEVAGRIGMEASDSATEPPRSGRGSGRDAWALFAAGHDIDVHDDDSRDDIIARLAAENIVTE